MIDIIQLDPNFSTTRRVSKADLQEMAEVVKQANKPEDKFETVLFLPEGEERQGEGGLRTKGYFKQTQDDKPLITVVTVVYNGEQFLEETILSVINQTYDNVEYIIVDGGSTDGTIDIIRKYEFAIDYWVSEKDKGISDAFNKGISLANGACIQMINAGDYLVSDSILLESSRLLNGSEILFFAARVDHTRTIPSNIADDLDNILLGLEVPHQTSFVPLIIYKKNGFYNTSFKIRMDYEFFLRVSKNSVKFHYCPKIILSYLPGGISMLFKNRFRFNLEAYIADSYHGHIKKNTLKEKFKTILSVLMIECIR